MKKKQKKREPLLILSSIFVIVAIVSGGLLIHHLFATFSSHDAVEQLSVDEEDFEYVLRSNATEFQTSIFDDLMMAHENYKNVKSEGNRAAYANAVVKNFIADFYTWSNKSGRTDIGGLQFIASDLQSDFKSYAIDNFYLYLNQYIEIHGQESLITVSSIGIENIELDYELEVGTETDEETGEVLGILTETVIKVEATWEYEFSNLEGLEDFQRGGTFFLTEENGRIVIRVIQEPVEEPIEDSFY